MIKKNVKLTLVAIGPDNIDEYIAKCRVNRSKSARHVGAFIRLIKRGFFRDGGIIFIDSKGRVQDGQHRLFALKQTSHTATFWVLSGLDPEDLNMMADSGKKRSNSARLTAAGYANAGTLCAAIEEIIDTLEGWRAKADMLMFDEVWAFVKTNPSIVDITKSWVETPIADIKIAYTVAFYYLFGKIDQEKNNRFFNALRDKANQSQGHPIRAFHEMLQNPTVRKSVEEEKHSLYNRYVRNGLLIAWTAFISDQKLDHIEPTQAANITLEGTPVAQVDSDDNGECETEPSGSESSDEQEATE
jgi:hypothetical protein